MAFPNPSAAFEVRNPDRAGPVIVSVPHAGRHYAPEMLALMRPPPERLLALEDRLIDAVVEQPLDAPVLVARVPRGWIDLNRDESEIDPGLVDGYQSSRLMLTPKVRSGLGLIPRRVAGVGEIWRRRLSRADVEARIAAVHRPYHRALADLLAGAVERFGVAVLLDLHSMPPLAGADGESPARVVVGDRFGQSAARWATERVDAVCRRNGLRARENSPYAGGHIVERHGAPLRGVHAVQVELDRSLYLDPDGRLDPKGVTRTRAFIGDLTAELTAAASASTLAAAAE